MIPKKIHYCWFGKGILPIREKRCIESWKKFMPDFEFILWDEIRFDVNSVPFTQEAYQVKKYAFVADYVRLFALSTEGGIYLDTDVEIIRPLYPLLEYDAFGGFETNLVIQTGVIGSIANGIFVSKMFEYYQNRHFLLLDGSFDQTPNSAVFSNLLRGEGLVLNNLQQSLAGIEIFPSDYFCPINQATWEIKVTENSYCIHYLSGSWLSKSERITRALKSLIGHVFGFKAVENIRNMVGKKYN